MCYLDVYKVFWDSIALFEHLWYLLSVFNSYMELFDGLWCFLRIYNAFWAPVEVKVFMELPGAPGGFQRPVEQLRSIEKARGASGGGVSFGVLYVLRSRGSNSVPRIDKKKWPPSDRSPGRFVVIVPFPLPVPRARALISRSSEDGSLFLSNYLLSNKATGIRCRDSTSSVCVHVSVLR